MIRAFVVGAVLMLGMAGDHAILAQNRPDLCPARFRRDPVATNQAREAKKADLRRRGYPDRLLSLLDRHECVGCIELASSAFHIQIVYNDDQYAPRSTSGGRISQWGFEWDPQSERRAREDLAAGRIKAFYILNTSTRCQCCPDPYRSDASYADWDPKLELHLGHVMRFDEPSDLGPLPPDLVNPPRGWLTRVPNIERYTKPAKRVVQVLCRACQPLADRWNSAADTLDSLWNRKVNLLEGISITRNAIVTRRNQIARLEYAQLFDATESAANQREIERLTQINEQQESGIDRDERRLADLERSIAEQQQRMDAILKELQDCEAKCKTTTTTTDAQVSTPSPEQSSPVPPPDVAADAAPQAPVVPSQPAAAVCPDCTQHAAELARLRGEIEARNAQLRQLRDAQARNDGNIQNLIQLRADAAAKGNTARVTELEGRITELQTANRTNRAEQNRLREEITTFSEQIDKVGRDLAACNKACAGTNPELAGAAGITGAVGRPPERKVAADPLPPLPTCKECEALVTQLRTEHRRLQELAERANAAQRDFEEFEEQRVKVEGLKKELEKCKCPTTTTSTPQNTTGATPAADVTIGTPGVPGTPPTTAGGAGGPPTTAVCPDCTRHAAELARLRGEIDARNAQLQQLQDAQARNDGNIHNLTQLRADAAARGNTARVTELEGRITELQTANRANRAEQNRLREEITTFSEQIDKVGRDLAACNRACAGTNPELAGAAGITGAVGRPPERKVAADPLPPLPTCKECEALVTQLRTEHRRLQELAERANAAQRDFEEFEEQRVEVAELARQLEACNRKCTTTAVANTTPEAILDRPRVLPKGQLEASPDALPYLDPSLVPLVVDYWRACSETNDCPPIDEDCGVPGTCADTSGVAPTTYNLMDPSAWTTGAAADVESRIQVKVGDLVFDVVIRQVEQPRIGQWFNPLGLLAKRLVDNLDRWRASAGPRPLIRPRDVKLVEEFTSGQSVGLPKGVHVLLTDRGGSTGKTLGMQVLNLTGQPVRLASMPFVIEPIRQQAQQRVQQAFARLAKAAPVNIDLAAYCVEFLKLPPSANQIFRLAPANVQKKYEVMSKVLRSAYRVQHAGLLRPDSNPAAYTDSIKQWAVWAVEQKFNEKSFTEAFLGHTKKNVEAAGQRWSKPAEDMVRKVSPNRWRDIVKVLQGAGLPQ